jgi:hypothetical protein
MLFEALDADESLFQSRHVLYSVGKHEELTTIIFAYLISFQTNFILVPKIILNLFL